MTVPFWTPIRLGTSLGELEDTSILLVGRRDDGARLLTIGTASYATETGRVMPVRAASLAAADSPSVATLESAASLGQALHQLGVKYRVEAICIPPIIWRGGGKPTKWQLPVMLLASALVTAIMVLVVGGVEGGLLAVPAGIGIGFLVWNFFRHPKPTRILTAGGVQLDASNILDYAIARRLGERPDVRPLEDRRAELTDRADDLLTEYGELMLDVAYRIENSALFDSAVATTEAFNVAMVRYQNEVETLNLDELAAAVRDLEITYSVARDHAETVGLAHLPASAQPDARRAAKAARLAADAGTDGERAAAMDQVIKILRSLALYYLPEPENVRKELAAPPTTSPESGDIEQVE